MKNIVACVILVCATHIGFAQQVSHAMLKLRLSDGAPLSVNIDGQFINRNTSILRLDGLQAGDHKVEVYRNRDNDRRPKRIFTGTISLEPGTVYIGLVDLQTQRLRMKTRDYDPRRDGNSAVAAAPGTPDVPVTEPQGDDAGTDGFGSYPGGRDAKPTAPDFSRNPVPRGIISEARMTTLERQVLAKTTDGDRLGVLKSNLMSAKVSVAQLDKTLGWLNFESSRLELTDWATSRIADPEHLSQLEYRFSLEENKEAFRKQLAR